MPLAKTLLSDAYRSSIGRLSKRIDLVAVTLLLVFGAFVNAAGMLAPVMMWEHRLARAFGRSRHALCGADICSLGAVILPLLSFGLCAVVNGSKQIARRLSFSLVPLGVGMWAAHLAFHAASVWTMASVTWLQIVLLEAGLLLTLYVAWRMAAADVLKLFVPWAGVACLLFAAGIWIFFQPMQMRGMMH